MVLVLARESLELISSPSAGRVSPVRGLGWLLAMMMMMMLIIMIIMSIIVTMMTMTMESAGKVSPVTGSG